MGLLFYYLFHYLHPSPSSPSLFLPGLKVNINQRQHLCCVLLFILQSYAAAVAAAAAAFALGGGATHTRMWPLRGGFACCFVRCGGCELLQGLKCGVTQRMPRFKKKKNAPLLGQFLDLFLKGLLLLFLSFPPSSHSFCLRSLPCGSAPLAPRAAVFLLSGVRDDAGRSHILARRTRLSSGDAAPGKRKLTKPASSLRKRSSQKCNLSPIFFFSFFRTPSPTAPSPSSNHVSIDCR